MRAVMVLAPLALAACTGSYEPAPLTEKQAATLEKALAGRVAGQKVDCITRYPSSNMTVISNNVLLYRGTGGTIYRNDLIGSCNGLTRGDALITQSWGSQLCRGDLARSADLVAGFQTGACALGSFTPYKKAK